MFNRYLLNGLMATGVHYGVLVVLLEVFDLNSASIANLIAAGFGIFASFMGSRHFVFQQVSEGALRQLYRFLPLYAIISGIHTLVMWVSVDQLAWNYNMGFLLATALQTGGSFFGNKYFVFKS